MKAIIYSRVSTKAQSTSRQVDELRKVTGFDIKGIFREKVSAFSKVASERPALNKALESMEKNGIDCLMVHEISRLGRNTLDVLNLVDTLKNKHKLLYIHNLGITLNARDAKEAMFTQLIVTLMADLARLESEQLSFRIKSGIRARKERGLHTGRKVGSRENKEKFLAKHKDIQKFLEKGYSSREIQAICKCSPNTIQKVKKIQGVLPSNT